MTTTDEARVTDERRKFMESIVDIARTERAMLHCQSFDDIAEALIDYADRLAARDNRVNDLEMQLYVKETESRERLMELVKLRAELAEMVALLDTEPQRDAAWEHRRRALLAKLRGGTP